MDMVKLKTYLLAGNVDTGDVIGFSIRGTVSGSNVNHSISYVVPTGAPNSLVLEELVSLISANENWSGLK